MWIWGNRGCGKTHLLQAGARLAKRHRAAYFPLDSIGAALPPEALAGFASCRVLCVDDVDAVAGDLDWERALFRLFNEAAELRSRLIFAAASPPRQIEWRLEDWRSRAAACVVYHVRELDEAGRGEALRLRAAPARTCSCPPETLDYLMKRMPRDLRSLFDILDELDEAVAGRAAPPHHSLHPRRAREARRNKTIAQNQREDQQQAERGHPARGGIHQELGDREDRDTGPRTASPTRRCGAARAPGRAAARAAAHGQHAERPRDSPRRSSTASSTRPRPTARGSRSRALLCEAQALALAGARRARPRARRARARDRARHPTACRDRCTAATWLAPYGVPPPRVSVRPRSLYGRPTRYMP